MILEPKQIKSDTVSYLEPVCCSTQSQGSSYPSSPRPGSGLPQNKNSLYWHLSVKWTGGSPWQCRKSGSERGEPHSSLWPLTPGKLAPRCRTQFACLASDREQFSVCPWNFPGKNTGVGCHFLLQCTAAGTLEPKVPSGGCPQPRLVVAAGRQLPDVPGVAERGEERAAAGGSDGRRGSPELRRDQQRLKFLLSRCPFSGSVVCGFPPPSPRLPVSSLSFPAREHLKGPRGPFHASGYTLQTPPWQVLLVNISIHEPGCPTAPSGEKSNCSGSQIRANGNLACFSCHPWLPCTFLQMEPPSQRLQKSSGPA